MPKLYIDSITGEARCQEDIELIDGRRNWKERKRMTLKVAKLMDSYDKDRAARIRKCGTYLVFVDSPGGKKLHGANFCRERMCPMCQWRRSLRLSHQADEIYRELTRQGYKHVFATLTVKNVTAEELSPTLDMMYAALVRLTRSKAWKDSFLGAYCALEVTYNAEERSFHPHFHMVLTVPPYYFNSGSPIYRTTDWLAAMWREACRLDYEPICDLRAVTQRAGQSLTSACVEACKYPTKSAELPDAFSLSAVDYALRGRRLIRWTGLAADVRKQLMLADDEDGDLIHTSDEAFVLDEQTIRQAYVWRHGFYIPIEFNKVIAEDA